MLPLSQLVDVRKKIRSTKPFFNITMNDNCLTTKNKKMFVYYVLLLSNHLDHREIMEYSGRLHFWMIVNISNVCFFK